MQSIGPLVEYAVFAVLIVLSIMAVAIAFERLRFYRTVQATRYSSRARLEADLTRRLNLIGTIGANAPYIGLLGTVLGIMVTFQTLGSGSNMDVKSIMTGLSLALKATAAGIAVAHVGSTVSLFAINADRAARQPVCYRQRTAFVARNSPICGCRCHAARQHAQRALTPYRSGLFGRRRAGCFWHGIAGHCPQSAGST